MIEKIKNLRNTEKGNTLFKFILYMIFFIFVLIICIFGSSTNGKYTYNDRESEIESTESVTSTKKLTYFDKQELLYKGKYDFEFNITGQLTINYVGEFDKGTVNGYKETEGDLIRYSIVDGITYKHSLTTKEEYDGLYEGLDKELFHFKSLFSKLNSTSGTINNTKEEKIYKYENIDNYTYQIITVEEGIESILIENEVIKYEFKFSY